MSRIESRPARTGLCEYQFFVDVLGHRDDAAVESALR
jgi:chorismate mutase/prephenate dehydratase